MPKVVEFVDLDGGWDWQQLFSLLPRQVCNYIAGISPRCCSVCGFYSLEWLHDRGFSIRFYYSSL